MKRSDEIRVSLSVAASLTWAANCVAQPLPLPPWQTYVLEFGGVSIAVAPPPPALELGPQFTMEAWVLLKRITPGRTVIMGQALPASPTFGCVLAVTDGHPEVVQSTGLPGSLLVLTGASPLDSRTWNHLAATLAAGTVRLYLNGVEIASAATSGPPSGGSLPFALGAAAQPGSTTCCWADVALRQARVWSQALSGAELLAGATVRLKGNEEGLVAYWPLDEGSGQVAFDHGPHHLDLLLGYLASPDYFDPRWVHAAVMETGPYFVLEGAFMVLPGCPSAPPCLAHGGLVDFDSDGALDAIINTARSDFALTPLVAVRNDGSGHFVEASGSVFGGRFIDTIANVEFVNLDANVDHLMDFFVTEFGPDRPPFEGGQNRLLIQYPGGLMVDETETRLPLMQAITHSVAVADITGDGAPDLYVGNLALPVGPAFYVNDGSGHFARDTTPLPDPVANGQAVFGGCELVDIDRDGDVDLVLGSVADQNNPRDTLLLNDGTGHFSYAPPNSLPVRQTGADGSSSMIVSADFDNDAWPDLLMIQATGTDPWGQRLVLLLNNRDGTFRDASEGIPQHWVRFPYSGLDSVHPGDFNNDGRADFVAVGAGGATLPRLFLNVGRAEFIDATELLPIEAPMPGTLLPADLDGNGTVDLFGAEGPGCWVLRNVKLFPALVSPARVHRRLGRSH